MKRLILFELMILFLATTFESDSPPGWYLQVLPVSDQINDIFFLDSLTGWVVTDGRTSTNDTGYIMKTLNGGENWTVQYNQPVKLNVVQFTDNNTGYVSGGSGSGTARFFKTINNGTNWSLMSVLGFGDLDDMYFINNETGWVCDKDAFGGLARTTNGGVNWEQQLNDSYQPLKLFFINKDTGWAGSANWKLYRTTNSGLNWSLQFTFAQQINDIHFFNKNVGIVSSGFSYRTTDGGFNWVQTNDGGIKLSFANDSMGMAGSNFLKIMRTTTGGNSWFRQTSPIFDNSSVSAIDSLKGWAGGTGLVKTTDGGGPPVGITQTSNEIPSEYKLYQNYPNPFNPNTKIKYSVKRQTSNVKLVVFDVQGRFLVELVNQNHSAGTYETALLASDYSSGIYLYTLIIDGVTAETKKMLLLK